MKMNIMKTMSLDFPYILLHSHILALQIFIVFFKRERNKVLEIDDNLNKIFFFDVVKFEIIEKRIACSPCE